MIGSILLISQSNRLPFITFIARLCKIPVGKPCDLVEGSCDLQINMEKNYGAESQTGIFVAIVTTLSNCDTQYECKDSTNV